MKRSVKALLVLSLFAPLTGCEYHKLQELNYAEPEGTPFQKALWANYRELTREEERNYDWSQAVAYADKALKAAYGEDVLPDDPALPELPDSLVKQFEKAREDLMGVLAGDAKTVQPQLVADAQTHYDCWLEHQAENTQPDEIENCRDGFYDAMQQLITPAPVEPIAKEQPKKVKAKHAAKPSVKKAEIKPAPAPAPKPELQPEPVKEMPKAEPVFAPEPVKEEPKADLAPLPATEPVIAPDLTPQVAPTAPGEPAAVPFNPPKETKEAPAAAPAVDSATKPQSMLKKSGKEMETASYIVFFDAGQAGLNSTAEKIVDGAAQSLLKHKSYRVIVNARNDLFGNVESGLPGQRAQMVKDRLVLQGIPESSIDLLLAGEASPAAGPQSTPVDRRVEIFISE